MLETKNLSDSVKIKCNVDGFKLVDINLIIPNPRNNNRHSIEQLEFLTRIIKAHGFREPLTISNRSGFLNCGHARLEVAKILKMPLVPVMYQDFDSEAEEYQHMTADNEIQRMSELDFQGVYDAMKEIPDINPDLLGIDNFKLPDIEAIDIDEEMKDDINKKYIIEVTFPNDMEMMDIHDDLVSRGYIVRIK